METFETKVNVPATQEKKQIGVIKINNEFGKNAIKYEVLSDGRLAVGEQELLHVLKAVARDKVGFSSVSVEKDS